ncbi:MAG TPA: hypothetical protein VFZ09_27320 [Archangium sp.]|nr:hypothetical protein [Archangium sp.]HEX5749971.1 hypothetical protein [Archangium sp.]
MPPWYVGRTGACQQKAEQLETVLASWGVDSSRLGQDQGPYPY